MEFVGTDRCKEHQLNVLKEIFLIKLQAALQKRLSFI